MVFKDQNTRKRRVIIIYDDGDPEPTSEGKLTGSIIIICIAVAFAGLTFGYDISITGGVTKMESFLKKFFPKVVQGGKQKAPMNRFCIPYSPQIGAYSSSLYIAAIFSALLAGRLTTSVGRKGSLIIGGIICLIGMSIHALSVNIQMLFVGRALTGFGMGFTNQTAPIYLAEMAPTKWRGAIGTGYQIFVWTGVTVGNWVNNFLTPSLSPNNWRIAIGLCGIPATLMSVISFFIPDTPSSLIQRGQVQQALSSLNQVRGVNANTETELKYLIKYNEDMRNASETPYRILLERKYRPHLFFAVALPILQHLVGRNLNNMIGPVIAKSLGPSMKILPTIFAIQDSVFMLCLFTATILIDRVGRRILLIQAGFQIFLGQLILAKLVGSQSESAGHFLFPQRTAFLALMVRLFIGMAIGWSWGPLTFILNCEILPIEVRSAGQGLATAINFLFHLITIQTVYPLLCRLKYGVFLLYAASVVFVTLTVLFFLPETKRIPLESMDVIWHRHWYWHRFVDGQSAMLKSEVDDDRLDESESESESEAEAEAESESVRLSR